MGIQDDIALVNKYLMEDLTPNEPTVQAFNRIADRIEKDKERIKDLNKEIHSWDL